MRDREAERLERVERLLGTDLRQHVKPASEMMFDYEKATRIAQRTEQQPS